MNELQYKVQKANVKEGKEHHQVIDNYGQLVYPTGNKDHAEGVAMFLNDTMTPHRDGFRAFVQYWKDFLGV